MPRKGPAPGRAHPSQFVVFAAVSAGCAAAAIATGSYALWLSRRKMTDEALTNVRDILQTCKDRVTQMEEELNHLSSHSSSAVFRQTRRQRRGPLRHGLNGSGPPSVADSRKPCITSSTSSA